jgi:hypothetical protein
MSYNIWHPQADASQGTPAEFDHHKDVWTAEVHAARLNSVLMGRMVRNAQALFNSDGTVNRNVSFLVTGRVGSEKHMQGDTITGTQRNSISRDLTIDARPNRTAVTDEYITRMFEQVPVRQGILDNMGFALAARDEVEIMKGVALAARTAAVGSESTTEFLRGGNFMFAGGEALVANASGTNAGYTADFGFDASNTASYTAGQANAKALAKALKTISIGWGKRNIRAAERYCCIPLDLFYDFRELEIAMPTQTGVVSGGIYGNTEILGSSLPFTQMMGGEAPLRYMGFTIFPHNFFTADFSPEVSAFRADRSSDPDRPGNFTSTIGLVWQQEAFGWADIMRTGVNVERRPLSTEETAWAMSWTGGGTLRPEAAVELKQSA